MYKRQELDKAHDIAKKCIDYQLSINSFTVVDSYMAAGLICFQNGEHQLALTYYQLVFDILPMYSRDKQDDYLIRLYNYIALIHLENNEITHAQSLCSKASLMHDLRKNNRMSTIVFYLTMGLIECKQDNYYAALDYLGRVWEIIFNEDLSYPHWHRLLYNSIGHVYFKLDQVELSVKFYTKSLSMYKDCRKYPCREEVYKNLGVIYEQDKEKHYIALAYYKRASKQITNKEHVHYSSYRNMITILGSRMGLWSRLKALLYSLVNFGF